MSTASESVPLRIPDVFNGKSVFITGANGFLGKVLLEKLLRSCPGIDEIIVLLNGQGIAYEDKKQNLLRNNVFDRIKQECPEVLEKLRFISGDVREPGLCIDSEEKQRILTKVSIVFHCAASVRFEDPPRAMLKINLVGVDNVFQLCSEIKSIEAIVHVSTAYSFCHVPYICEELYREKCNPEVLLNVTLHNTDDIQLETLCDAYRKARPSNYQFSKAMAECLIADKYHNLPVVVVRPAIITGAAQEPFPGWVDNLNGPSGFIALSSKGILKTLLVRNGINADWVPVDIVANTLITAACFIFRKRCLKDDTIDLSGSSTGVPIINCVCPEDSRITWTKVVDMCIPLLREYPSKSVCTVPGGVVTSSPFVHALSKYFFHFLPAFLFDTCNIVFRSRIQAVRQYQRIHGVMNHLQLYTTHHFYFSTKNMQFMMKHMLPEDMKIFPINQGIIPWPEYVENCVKGVRQFHLKENEQDLETARQRVRRLRLLMATVKVTPVLILLVLFAKRYSPVAIPYLQKDGFFNLISHFRMRGISSFLTH